MSEILEKAGFKGTLEKWNFEFDTEGCKEIYTSEKSIASTVGLYSETKDEANARLIATAPELLEHLIKLTTILEIAYSDKKMVIDARKVINKALNLPEDGQ